MPINVPTTRSWVAELFETHAGRLTLDAKFGDGFGTYPSGAFAEGLRMPVLEDLRDRVNAARADAAARAEIRQLVRGLEGEGGDPFGFMVLAIDGQIATPGEFLAQIKREPRNVLVGLDEVTQGSDTLSLYRELSERELRAAAKA